jgi:mannose-6-phosphate isomerase-like protein (cupin superfamily)
VRPARRRTDTKSKPEGGNVSAIAAWSSPFGPLGESTGGAFSIVEEIHTLDTPPHIHHSNDELFYVLEGDHIFTVGDTEFEAGPGDLIFGPRGVPHAHRRVVPRAGRILEMFSPAGFEAFFRDLAEADRTGQAGVEDLRGIAAKFGATFLG